MLFKNRGKKGNIHFEFSILIYNLRNKLPINILNQKRDYNSSCFFTF